jgi:sRNA-binding carbon storage regulator CsrA
MLVLTMRPGDKVTLYEDGKEVGFVKMIDDTRNFHRVGFEMPDRIQIVRDNAKIKWLDPSKP